MVLIHRLLSLPPAIIGLILDRSYLGQAQELEWPYNLPAHVKYYPEDEFLAKKHVEVRRKLQQQAPLGVKKMSSDPGEMFFLHYWHFDLDTEGNEDISVANISSGAKLTAPCKLHANFRPGSAIFPRIFGRTLFDKRNFECPGGSTACTSIDRPNSCCADGSTCQIVEDVGLGDVGCCPDNEVCSGSVSTCPADHISCPQNPGGGCCVPGYACFQEGCVATSTAVITVIPTITQMPTSTPASTSPSSPPTQTETQTQTETTTFVPVPVPTTSSNSEPESTTSAEPTITTTPTSISSRPNTLVCSPGFRSCPASLGGGCCPTDRACGRDLCPELSSTNSFTAPARPTSNTADATTTSTATGFSTIPGMECPTGFYACSAFYQGGCCQTGRNCEVTSCPPGGSITVVDGSSVTIDAPTGSGISSAGTLVTGSCASGWMTCAADVGGGCCPSGYACGTACTATATGGQGSVVGKIAPNEARKGLDLQTSVRVMGASLVSVAMVFGYFA